jgi:Zn-finger nucleic acid-binding protein
MALLFQGAAFCPSCGAARSRAEEAQPHSTKCPACGSDMHWVRVGDVDLLECGACDGTWIEAGAFERLCAQREHQSAVLQRRPVAPTTATAPSAAERVRYRPCPQCRKMMNRLNFGRLSGAIIDVCAGHGTFLDRGELHQVVQFVLDGGLDRMRQIELSRLKEEQQRLLDQERSAARLAGRTGSASSWPGANERWIQELLTQVIRSRK